MAATRRFANAVSTTLSGSMTNAVTTMSVASATGFPTVYPFDAHIESEGANADEIVSITSLVSGTTFNVTRASETYAGSASASAHSSGANVRLVVTATALGNSYVNANTGSELLYVGSTGGARDIVELGAKGLKFGGDSNIYSDAATTLKTDSKLIITKASAASDQLQITDTTAGAGLIIGADVNLYRSAANTLKTDDSLVVVGAITGIAPIARVYSAGTTWNKPSNLTHIIVECIGGGGAGGGGQTGVAGEHSKGGGGGAGSYSRKLLLVGALSASHTVTVGAGGTGVSAGTGNTGADSSFGTLCIGKGGLGGVSSATSIATFSGALGGIGGAAGTGDITGTGQPGGWGFGSGALATGGVGGGTSYAGGGQGASSISQPTSNTGGAGDFPGGGGGGATRTGTGAAATGGAGGTGIVVVTEFYAS